MPATEIREIQTARLLNAVGDVCAEAGYHGTTIRKLLGRSGISRKTFYELFADKEDCYLRAYDEAVEHVAGLIGAAYAHGAGPDPDSRLRAALRAYLEFCAANPNLARAFVIEVVAAGPRALQRRGEAITRLTDALASTSLPLGEGEQSRWLKARLFIGGVHELTSAVIEAGEVATLPELTDGIVDVQLPAAAER
jgi:AcrR family transcriptional regulator